MLPTCKITSNIIITVVLFFMVLFNVHANEIDQNMLNINIFKPSASTGSSKIDSLIKSDNSNCKVNWYIIDFSPNLSTDQTYVIDLGYTDYAEIYRFDSSITYNGTIGYFVSKKIWPKNQIYPETSPTQFVITDVSNTFLIRFKNISPWSDFKPVILDSESWKITRFQFLKDRNLTQGFFYGALIVMLLFNFSIYLIYKDKAFLFYSLYIVSLCLALLPPFELAYSSFLANSPYLIKHVEMIGDFGFIIFYFIFISSFLNFKERYIKVFRIIKWCLSLIITSFIISQLYFSLTGYYTPTQIIYQINSVLSIVLIILIFITITRDKDVLSKYIITGTVMAMMGSASVLFGVMFNSNYPYLEHYFMEFGHLAELFTFALGLGVRFKIIEKEHVQYREINDFKSAFFANITHEFRTPLTLIISPIEDHLKKNKNISRDILQSVLDNGRKLLNLINQLLDLSKLDSGKMKVSLSDIDVMKYIKSYAMTFESLIHKRNIQQEVNCVPGSLNIATDVDKLNKILNNLIFNAIKYTPEKKGKITISANETEKYLVIKISDNGVGIDSNKLPNVFERYFQSNNLLSGQISEGTGIGLSLCKELVELMEGDISIESVKNEGTTVQVRIPTIKPRSIPVNINEVEELNTPLLSEVAEITGPSPLSLHHARKISDNEKIILIVEDNIAVRDLIKSFVSNQYTIIEAENGNVGLQMAQEYIPDIIISDLMMPEMDGLAMTETIKTTFETSHIPVIMLTARGDTEDKIKGLETGADAYLIKPFIADELKAQITNLLKQREKLQQLFSQQFKTRRKHPKLPAQIQKFIELTDKFIEENLDDEEFDVVKLSELLKMNRSSLFRKLKSITGHTPSVYIRNYRLNKSVELLKTENLSISEIAFKVGFGNVSYFNKSFKEYFNVTPTELISN